MNDRFHYIPDWNELWCFLSRLEEPYKIKKSSTIFVGSMSDICYWKDEWIFDVINVCCNNPQHTFLFLTKHPKIYISFTFPSNCILGITITGDMQYANIEHQKLIQMDTVYFVSNNDIFCSIEPLLGNIPKTKSYNKYKNVYVGAMTGPNAIKPEHEWIQSVIDNILKEKIYWKDNIRKYL